ncbi:tetraacyldisaccharide 4'-kinase [Roseateles violae]|uniref:Tetraacyldisaccharide 4'-kinase n=1 Tax=Roseateles violae TaxID=3058042 RepID=A0ABT8DY39_9BURK|nr:tetraacyldisaccharide 4'-kinase [Pelomonas sp. PFR6]MDN3922049.1 tetraacyldisaccharide 4'-kinase [Pelomonas sp. PFR6]
MALGARLQAEWLTGGPLSTALRPLSALYGALLALRRWLYASGWLKTETLPVPVLVVGNWIVGGAGKTPTILALLQLLRAQGLRVGVISRGYGRSGEAPQLVTRETSAREVGDEPLLIHLRGVVPVAVAADRVAAARLLLDAHPRLQLLLSDDGLQHLRLPRSLSVLVFDERGIGNGRLLPAGPLRQPPSEKLAANELVLYNAARPTTALPGFVARRRLSGASSLANWWLGQPASPEALAALRGRPLVAAAGMAQPQRFFDMLAALGLSFTPLPLPDHHDFATLPWPADAADVVLTEKDAVKLQPTRCGSTRVWVVALDFQPEQAFEQALREQLAPLL